jgi:hypothetical protein
MGRLHAWRGRGPSPLGWVFALLIAAGAMAEPVSPLRAAHCKNGQFFNPLERLRCREHRPLPSLAAGHQPVRQGSRAHRAGGPERRLIAGAYPASGRGRDQHLDPAQAVQAFRDLRARHFIGMHWGTFDLTDEPLDEPPKELARVLRNEGIDPTPYHVMAIGETLRLPANDSAAGAASADAPSAAPSPPPR